MRFARWMLVSVTVVAFLAAVGGCAAGGGGGGRRVSGVTEGSDGNQNDNPAAPGPNDGASAGTDDNAPSGGEDAPAPNDDAPAGNDDVPDVPDDDAPDNDAAVVKTQIIIGLSGEIDVGDDLIVYGVDPSHADSNQPAGVHYIIPSACDNRTASGTTIPGSDLLFSPYDFKVAGRKVALVRSTFAISIYDTETGRLVDIPLAEVSLFPTTTRMTSDGPFIATINNTDGSFSETAVADGNPIKVIDVSGDDPVVLSFPAPDDPDAGDWWWDQTAVDADSRRVVALADGNLYLYDLDAPGSKPTEFDFGYEAGNGWISDEIQIRFDGDFVLYHDNENFDPVVSLLNVADGTITRFSENPSFFNAPVALAGGSFAYFLFREDADEEGSGSRIFRSAIGRVEDAPSATLANQLDRYAFRPTDVDEPGAEQDFCRGDRKRIGYGETLCITPDGRRWFLAGQAAVHDRRGYVQVSTGGAFEDISDPERSTYTGSLMGSDIVCSANTVAFRGLREVDDVIACGTTLYEVIAFIRLDRFNP